MAKYYSAWSKFGKNIPMHPRRHLHHTGAMAPELALLGFTVALIVLMPPGPVAMALVEVGVTQGRSAGARGALGIASGDILASGAAATALAAGAALPPMLFSGVRVGSAVVFALFGFTLVVRPGSVKAAALSVRRPGRAFFAITSATPTVFAAWFGLLGTLPFVGDTRSVVTFLVGGVVASAAWHLLVGVTAAQLSGLLSQRILQAATRCGGAAMMVLATVSLASATG